MTRCIRILSTALAFAVLGSGCDEDTFVPQYNQTAEATFDLAFDVTTQTVFDLQGVNGIVLVTGSDTVTEATISGTRRVRSDTQADADSRLDDLRVITTVTADTIRIHTEQPDDTQGRSYEINYTVMLPAYLYLDIDNVNGNITASHNRAELDVTAVNGTITVSDARDPIDVAVVNGNIQADLALSPGGEASLATVNGNINLSIPAGTSAELSATRTNGTVTTSNLTLTGVSDDGHIYTGRLGSGQGEINLRTVNGNIAVRAL
jgi:hypothetical protein